VVISEKLRVLRRRKANALFVTWLELVRFDGYEDPALSLDARCNTAGSMLYDFARESP
jgi:hypothetical protein